MVDWEQWKQRGKDTYQFIFYEDSVVSNLAFAVVAYIVIKYALFPLIGWMTGTSLPIVAVISQSMHHPEAWWTDDRAVCDNGPCSQEAFYEQYGIDQAIFQSYPFNNGFNRGDIMLVSAHSSYEPGDVVIYQRPRGTPVIHRVIDTNSDGSYVVKGDNNRRPLPDRNYQYQFSEYRLPADRIEGAAYARIPYVGYVKLALVEAVNAII